ncbi:MAG: FAD-dependent oxidoreductase [Ketobacteraceae bacterium]|nr:FAD-dependent oxidoreductase [Ketobacteraceae bacterium]
MDRHNRHFDVTVIGGGLHGAAIAADCAGRGLRTLLCDRDDVGGNHNLVSTRLFHCGLQYLQRGDLSRVSESLRERAILIQRAPHLVHPTTVILPQSPGLASRLKTNTKAWLYNLVAGQQSQLEATDIAGTALAQPLKPLKGDPDTSCHAIRFEDALLNDARLTIENLLLAREAGATILPHTQLSQAERSGGNWDLLLQDTEQAFSMGITSRCVINAAGPDAERVQRDILGIKSRCSATRYRAGYLVVPRLFEGSQSYLIENEQEHVVAALPCGEHYTLVGPLICPENRDQAGHDALEASQKDRLLALISRYFRTVIHKDEVVSSFAVSTSSFRETPEARPTPFSQDYVLDFNCSDGRSPAVTLFGACVNMHRVIAEQVVEQIALYLDDEDVAKQDWTARATLPGARSGDHGIDSLRLRAAERCPWLPVPALERMTDLYGERFFDVIKNCKKPEDLGQELLPSLYEREVRWLRDTEWALSPEAILWHRTKLGLTLSKAKVSEFNQWFIQNFRYRSALADLHSQLQLNKEAS